MIKKILFSLGIIGLGIINFSNGEACFSLDDSPLGNHFHFDLGENFINDLYGSDFKFLNHGNFLINNSENNFNGEYIALRFFQEGYSSFYSNYLIFWTSNGLYFADNMYNSSSSYDIQRQMYFPFLGIYDGLNGTVSFSISDNCGNNYIGHDLRNIDFPLSIFEADNLLSPDSVDLYLYPSTKSICFRYSNLNKSACFWYRNNYLVNNSLVSTLNPINFDSLSNIVGDSPLGSPSDGGSSSGIGTGIILECTKQNALNRYKKNGYTKNLCYGGLSTFEVYTGSPLGYFDGYGTGYDFEEIRLETANLRAFGETGTVYDLTGRLYYWDSQWTFYGNGDGLYGENNPFLNTPYVLMSYIGAVNTYGSNFNKSFIIDYCDLLLYTSDYTVSYTGGLNSDLVCDPINLASDRVSDSLSNGVNIVGTGETISDGKNFMQNYFDLINSKLGGLDDTDSDPIIPSYIVLALCGLVLFRFLSH